MADNAPSGGDRPMRALVVGADGFVGRWLVRHLLESGDEVHAIVGPRYRDDLQPVASVHRADVRTYDEVAAAVAASGSTAIYYLAAVSEAGGREHVENAVRIGLVGAIHTMTAAAALGEPVRLLYVSSAHVYGGGDELLTEESPVEPTSVYGAVKAAGERAVLTLGPATGVEVVVARAFNHIGPGQGSGFVVPSLAARIRALPTDGRGSLAVGALDTERDFTDVRDVVRAYRLLVDMGTPGEVYNVASGSGTSVRALVEMLLDIAGTEAELRVDDDLHRGGERRVMVGDASKVEALGWRRRRTLRDTLVDVMAQAPTQ